MPRIPAMVLTAPKTMATAKPRITAGRVVGAVTSGMVRMLAGYRARIAAQLA